MTPQLAHFSSEQPELHDAVRAVDNAYDSWRRGNPSVIIHSLTPTLACKSIPGFSAWGYVLVVAYSERL